MRDLRSRLQKKRFRRFSRTCRRIEPVARPAYMVPTASDNLRLSDARQRLGGVRAHPVILVFDGGLQLGNGVAGRLGIYPTLVDAIERIGHGLNAWQDRELMAALVERQIPVEICLSSNLRTGCCAAANKHPLKTYFDVGVMVTLNTDDPAMFETSLEQEYGLAQKEFGFSDEQLREIARNSFEASFLPAEKKLQFLDMVDAFS